MTRTMAAILFAATLVGCASTEEKASEEKRSEVPYRVMLERNTINISGIESGMPKEQVTATMGVFISRVPDGILLNPWLTESKVIDNTTHEVMYYLVRLHPPFTPIRKRQATAVVLKDGVVVGIQRGDASTFEL